MKTLPADLEALMPEPAGFRTRYRSEPGMIGYYPWSYADATRRRPKYDRPEHEYEDLFTADQVREAMLAATERAAKMVEDSDVVEVRGSNSYYCQLGDAAATRAACAAAIRSGGEAGS